MSQGIGLIGLYVRDQDEAREFYVDKLGFTVHTDVRNGDYRWLTVQHPDQPSFQLGLFKPQAPVLDDATAQSVREIVAKGAMPPMVLNVEDCRAAYHRLRERGVEFTQAPEERYGNVDLQTFNWALDESPEPREGFASFMEKRPPSWIPDEVHGGER